MDSQQLFEQTREAGRKLVRLSQETITAVLLDLAKALEQQAGFLLEENRKDLERMRQDDPKYDRLQLTPARIAAIADDVVNVAGMVSPIGSVLLENTLPNRLHLTKVVVPIGVIGIIYEARPNVTCDAFVLCFKTGNACILKGGSDAQYSNQAMIQVIKGVLQQHQVDPDAVNLMPADRKSADLLLNAVGYVDVVIPRGSQQLIQFVREHARVPVIETGAGIVHTYFDESGDLTKGAAIICNAKTRRVSVCNSLDCLILHENRVQDLPELAAPLAEKRVEIFADAAAFRTLNGRYPEPLLHPAGDEHYGTEFLSLRMSVKTVGSLDEALSHINRYGSKHSEAIVTEDEGHMSRFVQEVDAAAVYVNASTAFTDGAQFGLGAEIGISTQKLHARGPMGLEALTSYKWTVRGDGQTRNG